MRLAAALLAVAVLAGCGSSGLSKQDKATCQTVIPGLSETLSLVTDALHRTDRTGIADAYAQESDQLRQQTVTLPLSDKVRKAADRLASEMSAAASANENGDEINFPSMGVVTSDRGIEAACKP